MHKSASVLLALAVPLILVAGFWGETRPPADSLAAPPSSGLWSERPGRLGSEPVPEALAEPDADPGRQSLALADVETVASTNAPRSTSALTLTVRGAEGRTLRIAQPSIGRTLVRPESHPGPLETLRVRQTDETSTLVFEPSDFADGPLWIGAPDRAWARVDPDTFQSNEARVDLLPSAAIDLHVLGGPASNERLTLRGEDGVLFTLERDLEGRLEVDGLVPGTYQAHLEEGSGNGTPASAVASAATTVTAGGRAVLELARTQQQEPGSLGRLIGTLRLTDTELPIELLRELRLEIAELNAKGLTDSRPSLMYSVSELERLPGTPPAWLFGTSDRRHGRFLLRLRPLGVEMQVELASELQQVDFEVPLLARTIVDVRDGEGRALRIPDASAHMSGERTPRRAWTHYPSPGGHLEVISPPGRITLDPRIAGHRARQSSFEVSPGWNDVLLVVAPVCSVRVELDAESTPDSLPISWWLGVEAIVRDESASPDPESQGIRERRAIVVPGTSRARAVELTFDSAGTYLLRFPAAQPGGAAPELTVHVDENPTNLRRIRVRQNP